MGVFHVNMLSEGLNGNEASTIVARNIQNNYRLPQAVVTIFVYMCWNMAVHGSGVLGTPRVYG